MSQPSLRKQEKDAEQAALVELKQLPRTIRHYTINGGRTHKIVLTRWWTGTEPKTHFFRTAALAWEFCQGEVDNKAKDRTLGLHNEQIMDARRAFDKIEKTGKTLFEVAKYFMDYGPGVRKVYTLSEAGRQYVQFLANGNKSLSYQHNLTSCFRNITRPENEGGIGDRPLYLYMPEDISKWFVAARTPPDGKTREEKDSAAGKLDCPPSWLKGWSLATTKNHYTAVAMLFKHAVRNDWLGANPILNPALDSVRNMFTGMMGKIEIYSLAECRRLLETAEINESQLDLLGWYTVALLGGIRAIELSKLQWEDFDFAENEIIVRPGVAAKGGEPRNVPINRNMREWLARAERQEGPFLDKTNLAKRIRALHKYAGVTHKQNAARHTFSTFFYSQNPVHSQAEKLRVILGHETDEVLFKHYAQMIRKPQAKEFWDTLFPKPLTEEQKVQLNRRREKAKGGQLRFNPVTNATIYEWPPETKKYGRHPNLKLIEHPDIIAQRIEIDEELVQSMTSPDLGEDQ